MKRQSFNTKTFLDVVVGEMEREACSYSDLEGVLWRISRAYLDGEISLNEQREYEERARKAYEKWSKM